MDRSVLMMFQEIAQLSKQLEDSSLRDAQLPALQRRIQVKHFGLLFYTGYSVIVDIVNLLLLCSPCREHPTAVGQTS